MVSLGDLLSEDSKGGLVFQSAKEGSVFRMHLSKEEQVVGKGKDDDGRNKYFVVIGHDVQGNAIGFVLIDSQINPNLPECRKLLHYPLLANKYSFLKGKDRFVDCSDFKTISKDRFASLFGSETIKGEIDVEDLQLIRDAIVSYENVSVKLLRRFGLINN